MTQIYKEQAKIIFNMINGITDDGDNAYKQEDDMFKVKNEYTWKEKGGSKLLEQLYEEDTNKDEESDTDNDFGATDLGGFARLRKTQNDKEDVTESLFGPIGLKKCEEMAKEKAAVEEAEESPKPAMMQADYMQMKKDSQVHIDVINMDNGVPEFDKKQVYVKKETGGLKRDREEEETQWRLDE